MGEQQPKVIKIRKARQGDVVALFRLLQQTLGEPGFACPEVDDNRMMAWVVDTVAHADTIVADLSGRVVGSVALAPGQMPWSSDWLLISRWLTVMPKFRREGTGRKLIQAAIAAADDKRAPVVLAPMIGDGEQWHDEFMGSLDGFAYGGGMFFRGAGA